ncbi:MAG: hypothetical protein ABSC22_14335 [Roseiarcus sp.]|jgi:hypothetical protein
MSATLKRTAPFAGIDRILVARRQALGRDFYGYRNHCQRTALFCLALLGDPAWEDAIAVAAAHHDLGIWTEKAWDYLAPSCALARAHLAAIGHADWTDEITAAIDNHHKLTAYRAGASPLPEAFRRADLIDLSLGAFSFGLDRAFIRAVRARFPNAEFHRRLAQLAGRAFVKNPLRALPMMRF